MSDNSQPQGKTEKNRLLVNLPGNYPDMSETERETVLANLLKPFQRQPSKKK